MALSESNRTAVDEPQVRFVDNHSSLSAPWQRATSHVAVNEVLKRCFDIPFAMAALFFLAPLMLGIAIVIKVTNPGPVIFGQPRYGRGREIFTIYKFRTMRHEPGNESAVVKQTDKCDGRTTKVGSFLRRTSLDELPQFFNVLKGDMSVVGPRPHAPKTLIEDVLIEGIVFDYDERHSVRPGITGLAQVSGFRGPIANAHCARQRFALDVEYTQNWSLWLDIAIVLKTIKCEVFGGTGY